MKDQIKEVTITLTGDIGSGKSTLMKAIAKLCTANGLTVIQKTPHSLIVRG